MDNHVTDKSEIHLGRVINRVACPPALYNNSTLRTSVRIFGVCTSAISIVIAGLTATHQRSVVLSTSEYRSEICYYAWVSRARACEICRYSRTRRNARLIRKSLAPRAHADANAYISHGGDRRRSALARFANPGGRESGEKKKFPNEQRSPSTLGVARKSHRASRADKPRPLGVVVVVVAGKV